MTRYKLDRAICACAWCDQAFYEDRGTDDGDYCSLDCQNDAEADALRINDEETDR